MVKDEFRMVTILNSSFTILNFNGKMHDKTCHLVNSHALRHASTKQHPMLHDPY